MKNKQPPFLIYSLYCGGLYGTEGMALATLTGLGDTYNKVLVCPPGAASDKAQTDGISTFVFKTKIQFIINAFKLFLHHKDIVIISTSISHSIIYSFLSLLLLKKIKHFHIVHGGADEFNSYERKKVLRFFSIQFIAVSNFVKEKLVFYGLNEKKIHVIENFIPFDNDLLISDKLNWPPKKIVLVSRLDPVKRLDLLVELLQKHLQLNQYSYTIYGNGGSIKKNQALADKLKLNITYAGYQSDIPERIKNYDLFLHLCPDEPFGLVILEAILAGIPVLVPDSGGPAGIIQDQSTGFVYKHNNIDALAEKIMAIAEMTLKDIDKMVEQSQKDLVKKYSIEAGMKRYIELLYDFEKQPPQSPFTPRAPSKKGGS